MYLPEYVMLSCVAGALSGIKWSVWEGVGGRKLSARVAMLCVIYYFK